nr:hypothetical protein [Tanacetum cinerariifolium]
MQEKHLDNIEKYQSLKRKPISVAQARKNMIVYSKNIAGYKIQHFKGMTYDQGGMEEDVTTIKEINDVEPEPTVFNDKEVIMTMAQTLIKMKAKKARILDEHMAKRLQDEEIEQAATSEK